ncbi:hypothetical protein [Ensifer sp. 4252]|uniref:hypothetical protein n=1 Tax=Ensifer sp. 4252 TaxID=3373915 RepID=UPI003D25C579
MSDQRTSRLPAASQTASRNENQEPRHLRFVAVPHVLLTAFREPFGPLGAYIRQDLRRCFLEIHDELGMTTLFAFHDQKEAPDLANRVLLDQSRIVVRPQKSAARRGWKADDQVGTCLKQYWRHGYPVCADNRNYELNFIQSSGISGIPTPVSLNCKIENDG